MLRCTVRAKLPTPWAEFTIHGFEGFAVPDEHIALSLGDVTKQTPVLARVHSQCFTGDTFFSLRCDCRPQLETALQAIAKAQSGVLIYLRQEGRGIGLLNKVRAYALQDEGMDTVEANRALGFADDTREYTIAADMLRALDVMQVRLLTNNPRKVSGLQQAGIEVVERVPLHIPANPHNERYLATKFTKLQHLR